MLQHMYLTKYFIVDNACEAKQIVEDVPRRGSGGARTKYASYLIMISL